MNYKQKCLDIFYASDVVNKELTFGCVLECTDNPHGAVLVTKENQYQTRTFLHNGHNRAYKFGKDEFEKEYKIIGHPPQLQDWLALLCYRYFIDNYCRLYKEISFDNHNVDKVELKLVCHFKDGHPTTKADWKALYELIK